MRIDLKDGFFIAEFKKHDSENLVKFLNDTGITDNTLQIPSPYTKDDAYNWLKSVELKEQECRIQSQFSIRNKDDYLVGGIGIANFNPDEKSFCEIGYWLATPFQRQGIVTLALKKFCQFLFKTQNFSRIVATTFTFNLGSQKVLLKAGFKKVGLIENKFFKNGRYLDGYRFELRRNNSEYT